MNFFIKFLLIISACLFKALGTSSSELKTENICTYIQTGDTQQVEAFFLNHSVQVEYPEGFWPLCVAVIMNQPKVVRLILNHLQMCKVYQVKTLNDCFYKGNTALILATKANRLELVEMLLNAGAKVEVVDQNNQDALSIGIKKGYIAIVTQFIQNANLLKTSKNALFVACEEEQSQIFKLLLKSGFDPNCTNANGESILHAAVKKANISILSSLLQAGANMEVENQYGQKTFHIAAMVGDIDIICCLLRHGVDSLALDRQGYPASYYAFFNDHHDIGQILSVSMFFHFSIKNKLTVQSIIDQLFVKNVHMKNVLSQMFSEDMKKCSRQQVNVQIVNEILFRIFIMHQEHPLFNCTSNSINLNQQGGSFFDSTMACLLHFAASNNQIELLKNLLKKKVYTEFTQPDGQTPFLAAVCKGHLAALYELIKANVNIHAKLKNGKSALCIAIENENVEMMRLLIQAGSKVNEVLPFNEGQTVLHMAVLLNDIQIIKTLLAAGADVNAMDAAQMTPFLLAAQQDNVFVAHLFIAAGANVNAQDQNRQTALHYAVHNDNIELVEFLLAANARRAIRDITGKTPLKRLLGLYSNGCSHCFQMIERLQQSRAIKNIDK